jgi:hypothetical protein
VRLSVKQQRVGAATLGPAVAQESERGIYIGGSVGYSQYQNACDRALVPCDEGDTAGRFFAGYQFNRTWSAEIGVGHFGEASGSGTVTGGAGTGSFRLKSDGWECERRCDHSDRRRTRRTGPARGLQGEDHA